MKAQHEFAMKLLGVCLALNEQGKYHAHYRYAPHTNAAYIYVLSAQTKCSADAEKPRFVDEVVYLHYSDAEMKAVEVAEQLRGMMS